MASKDRKEYLKNYYKKRKEDGFIPFSSKVSSIEKKIKSNYTTTVTTRLSGHLKKWFFEDVLKRQVVEAKMTRDIIEVYYSILGEFPELKGKEITDIKHYIITKMKS